MFTRFGEVYGRVGARWNAYLDTLTDEQLEFANELLQRAADVDRRGDRAAARRRGSLALRLAMDGGPHREHTGAHGQVGTGATPPSNVRAQLLSTEHAGLLAARSTAQSEVLTRISIFLTLFSASLVSIAFVGQATEFGDLFGPSAIAVLVIVVIVGQLTQVRVVSIGIEDLMYVLALNRIRSAWVELDPGVAPYLLTSPHDDRAGSIRTYDFFGTRDRRSCRSAAAAWC